jgi:3-dehydro-4-phosphotetronate decarboxylase
MYDVRDGAEAIIHLHSTHSAAVSCLDGLDHGNCIPPLTAYYVMKIGKLPLIPYHRPGDQSLERTIRELAKRHCAVLLANHGPVVSGTSLEAASFAIEELEETSKLFLLLRNSSVRPLSEGQIEDLKASFHLEF